MLRFMMKIISVLIFIIAQIIVLGLPFIITPLIFLYASHLNAETIKSKKDILGEEVSTVMEEDLKKSTSDEDTANRLNTVRQDLLTNLRDINLINELVLKPEEIDLYSNSIAASVKVRHISENNDSLVYGNLIM